jgi:hypothetical protein
MNLSRRASALLPIALLVLLSGCTTALKQAYYEIRGAKSKIIPVRDLQENALLECRSFRFEPVTTTVGDRICPPELRHAWDRHAAELASELREFYPGGDPGLLIASEILYFQKKGLLSGSQCLTRVKMREGERLIVDAIVRTESKSFREGGEDALAESNVKALGKFLKARGLEKEAKDEEEEEKQEE